MSTNNKWQNPDIKRFEFGRMGDKKVEILLAAALLAIIVVSLFLSLRKYIWPTGQRTEAASVHLICLACDHEFEMSSEEVAKASEGRGQYGGPSGAMAMMAGMTQPLADCPKCGEKLSAWIAMRCPDPECGTYYVSEVRVVAYEARQAGRPAPTEVRHECPKCGMSPTEWYRRKSQERRR